MVYAIFTQTNAAGQAPPLSSALLCTLLLCLQYFSIYLFLFVSQVFSMFSESIPSTGVEVVDKGSTGLKSTMASIQVMAENARATVMFAPMLSCLYLGSRLRALPLSRTVEGTIPAGAGSQLYVQDCMYLSAWSVVAQVGMVIILGVIYGAKATSMDADGNPTVQTQGWGAIVLQGIRFLCMASMYGGVVGMVHGVLTMTPEVIRPYNQDPLIPGVAIPAPPAPVASVESFLVKGH